MEIAIESRSASLRERVRNAWYAFQMKVAPDVEAALERLRKHVEAEQAEQEAARAARQASIDKLEPFDKAYVTSVATGSPNAEQLLGAVMPAIELLDIEDQLPIVRYIVVGNKQMVTHPSIRSWVMRNMRDVIANLPE